MQYWGYQFYKSSSVLKCRQPFTKDPSTIDYELDSEDEWHEMNCDNLEDDQLLLEDDNTDQNQDDPDLKREGFIVPDDYCSQDSSIYEDEEVNHKGLDIQRKDLLKRQLER